MDEAKSLQFNLRDQDGESFLLVKQQVEREYGPQSNAQVIRLLMTDYMKRKKIRREQ